MSELPAELNFSSFVFASANQAKVAEVRQILAGLSIKVLSPQELGVPSDFDPVEVGESFEEVARAKARAYASQFPHPYPVVADDSGLEVSALSGAPGVRSKRFAPGTDHDRNLKLLSLLKNSTDRSAQFVTVLCLFDPQSGFERCFTGQVEGRIGEAEHGTQGFGYDPLFIPSGFSQSFAELGSEVKNTISHRARAVQQLRSFLEQKATIKGS